MKKLHLANHTVQETLILPLYARKLGSELFPQILSDPFASSIISRLDYDFSTLDAKKDSLIWQFGALAGLLRSKDMLCEMQDYLSVHPYASVVNMGCGLDPTTLLGDNGKMKLYNIDKKDVIAMRRTILPPMDRETNIAADLHDDTWIRRIDTSHGTFLFAAGVFVYFEKDKVRHLVLKVKEAFPQSCLVFDTLGKTAVTILMKKTLETLEIHNIDGLFYSNTPAKDLQWSSDIEISVRNYLTGYVDLKEKGVRPLFRYTAVLFDRIFNIHICRMRWP